MHLSVQFTRHPCRPCRYPCEMHLSVQFARHPCRFPCEMHISVQFARHPFRPGPCPRKICSFRKIYKLSVYLSVQDASFPYNLEDFLLVCVLIRVHLSVPFTISSKYLEKSPHTLLESRSFERKNVYGKSGHLTC